MGGEKKKKDTFKGHYADPRRCSNCHRISSWRQKSVKLTCLPAWHRLEISPIKSCISPPQKLHINSSVLSRRILPDQARHPRLFQCQWRSNPASLLCPLNLYASLKAYTHTLLGYMPFSSTSEKGILPESMCTCTPLIRSEAKPRNGEQASTVQILHAVYLLAQLQSTQWAAGWMNGSGSSNLPSSFS